VAGAAHVLAQTGINSDDPCDHRTEVIQAAHLRLLLHKGRHAPDAAHLPAATDLADRLLTAAETAGRMGRVIELLALRSLVRMERGETATALADLSRALHLAEPEGYVQVFLNEGEPMRALLAQFVRSARPAAEPDAARLVAYAHGLLSAAGDAQASERRADAMPDASAHAAASSAAALVEPLTDRELEVLRLIADGLTYGQVADTLIVSVNTVRFHVKSIYGKLGVDNRTTAIEQARSLHLL